MHPHLVVYAIIGVSIDLLCLGGVAILLLVNNPWLIEVGYSRFWFVVFIVALGVVPMMYMREKVNNNHQYPKWPFSKPRARQGWADMDRAERNQAATA